VTYALARSTAGGEMWSLKKQLKERKCLEGVRPENWQGTDSDASESVSAGECDHGQTLRIQALKWEIGRVIYTERRV
jgi:hypothetical protein